VTTSPDPATTTEADEEVAVDSSETRRIRRPRDMVLSLAILLVPIVLILGVGRFLFGDSTIATVDPDTALQGAARATMQPLPRPSPPAAWRVVSAQYQDGVLRIGYLAPSGKGVQLVQGTAADLINSELGDDARPSGEVQAGGKFWSHWDARESTSALTRRAGATTIIVFGTASSADLALLAGTVSQ
jgi:hypothetical protein